jgi:hypothetical protein
VGGRDLQDTMGEDMSREDLVIRCRKLLGWLGAQVSIANSAGLTDINVVSESLVQNLFNSIEDGASYVNTNIGAPNADSIDLADEGRKIGVQVTSNMSSGKIKSTVEVFEKNKRQEQFSTLRFVFLAADYRPRDKYSVKGAKIEFENLGQLALRIIRIKELDRLRSVVDVLERELGPERRGAIELVRETATRSAELLRVECRIQNPGTRTVEKVQMWVGPSVSGHVDVIPKSEWHAIAGSGEQGSRTFQAEHAIHPGSSIRAIIQHSFSAPQSDPESPSVSESGGPVLRVRLLGRDLRPQYFEVQ